MKRIFAALLIVGLLAAALLCGGAAAAPKATPAGPDLLSFGAKRAEYFDRGEGRVKLHFYGTLRAVQFGDSPLRRQGRNLGPAAIAAAAHSGSTLTVELRNGRPGVDSMVVRVGDVRVHGGQLIVRGSRVGPGRARATLANPDQRLPKVMRRAILTLDLNPGGAAIEGPDGRHFAHPAIGLMRMSETGAARASGVEQLSNFEHKPKFAAVESLERILWQWVEKADFECTLYAFELEPMSVFASSDLEFPEFEPFHVSAPKNGEKIVIDEPIPHGFTTHFSVAASYSTSHIGSFELAIGGSAGGDTGTVETICEGNVEGSAPAGTETHREAESRSWLEPGNPTFEEPAKGMPPVN